MNEGIAHLTPYQVSAGAMRPAGVRLRLDWNEAQIPPSPAVLAAVRGHLEGLNQYPDVDATQLRRALGAYVGLPADHVRAYNGSDAALRDICAAFLSPGAVALVRRPVYTQIDTFLAVQSAQVVDWQAETAFTHDLDAHTSYLSEYLPSLAYLVNPNNPTGELYAPAEIGHLAYQFPGTMFAVDEAYIEFGGASCAGLVRTFDNLLVTRTFSKAFGLAGLRLGYVLGQPKALAVLDLVRNGKDVNALAQVAGIAAVGDRAYLRAYIDEVKVARAWAADQLRGLGYEVRETLGNWLLIKTHDPGLLVDVLREGGVLVRDRSSLPQMAGWVRVTVGTRAQMAEFVGDMIPLAGESV